MHISNLVSCEIYKINPNMKLARDLIILISHAPVRLGKRTSNKSSHHNHHVPPQDLFLSALWLWGTKKIGLGSTEGLMHPKGVVFMMGAGFSFYMTCFFFRPPSEGPPDLNITGDAPTINFLISSQGDCAIARTWKLSSAIASLKSALQTPSSLEHWTDHCMT